MAVLKHNPSAISLGILDSLDSDSTLATTKRECVHLLLHLSFDFHNVHHRISSGRKHDDDRSVVQRVRYDLLHVEGRRDDVVLAHLFFFGDQLLEHQDYLIWSEESHDNSLMQDTEIVPLAGPDVLIRLRVRAVIQVLPEADVLLHVLVKAFEYLKLSGHLQDTSPSFVG